MHNRPRLLGAVAMFGSILGVAVVATLMRAADRWVGETLQVVGLFILAFLIASMARLSVVSHKLQPPEVRRMIAMGLTYGVFIAMLTVAVLNADFFYVVGLCLGTSLLTRALLRKANHKRTSLLRRRSPWWLVGVVGLYFATDLGKELPLVAALTAGSCHGIGHSLRAELLGIKSMVLVRWQIAVGGTVAAFIMLPYHSHSFEEFALYPVLALPLLAAAHIVLGVASIYASRYPTPVSNALPLLLAIGLAYLSSVGVYDESITSAELLVVFGVAVAAIVADKMIKSQRYLPVAFRANVNGLRKPNPVSDRNFSTRRKKPSKV